MHAGVPAAMLGNVKVIATWTGASGNELASSHRISITPAVQEFGTSTYVCTSAQWYGHTPVRLISTRSGSLMFIDRSNGINRYSTRVGS